MPNRIEKLDQDIEKLERETEELEDELDQLNEQADELDEIGESSVELRRQICLVERQLDHTYAAAAKFDEAKQHFQRSGCYSILAGAILLIQILLLLFFS